MGLATKAGLFLVVAVLGSVDVRGQPAIPLRDIDRGLGHPVLVPTLDENNEIDYVVQYLPDLATILSPTLHQIRAGMRDGPEKRGIDLGLNRGFSGSQAARYMLGRQQASFAGGPGKRSA